MTSKELTFITKQLICMPLSKQHEEDYCALYTHHEIMRFVSPPLTKMEAKSAFHIALKQAKRRPQKHYIWAIHQQVDSRFCGIMGLSHEKASGRYFAGIMLLQHARGKGFSLESSWRLLEFVFDYLDLDSIYISHASNNVIVKQLSSKLGFVLCDSTQQGMPSEAAHYRLYKSQYLKKRVK
jgi:RimJ/RimL family protein N-acetyltransferase